MDQVVVGFSMTSVRIPAELMIQFDEKCRERKRSRNFILTELIKDYVEGKQRKEDD